MKIKCNKTIRKNTFESYGSTDNMTLCVCTHNYMLEYFYYDNTQTNYANRLSIY